MTETQKPTRGGTRPHAGRPVGPDGRAPRVSVRIPERLLARFDAAAARDGISRSRALVAALRAWLGELNP